MLLRAFSSGAVALSGVEAVSNGVPAFRKPEARNASMTLAIMAGILGVCFIGVSVLASHLKPLRGEEDPTGIALMAEHIYGGKGVLFWVTQLATFAILILAANTAYQGFPGCRRSSPVTATCPASSPTAATSSCSPTAIIFLAVAAGVLIVVFKGNISAADPALRVRRVHRVHAQPGRHGASTTSGSASRAGGRRWRSTPSAAWPRRSSPSSSSSPSSPRGRGSRPC